jgi:hypothetical protein
MIQEGIKMGQEGYRGIKDSSRGDQEGSKGERGVNVFFEGSRGIQRGQGESKDTKGMLRWVNGGQELTRVGSRGAKWRQEESRMVRGEIMRSQEGSNSDSN